MSHHHHHSCEHCEHQEDHCSQCCSCSCHDSDHHHEGHEGFSHELLEMADDAWMEVLKEKIKEQILATNGKKLDELAKIVASSNEARWKYKKSSLGLCHDYKQKIQDFFHKESN